MFFYLATCLGLLWLAVDFGFSGLHPLAMALFPAPVALFWVLRQPGRGLILVGIACLAALISIGTLVGVVEYALAAGIGVVMGVVVVRRWTFGRGVALVTAIVYILLATSALANWEMSKKKAAIALHQQMAGLQGAEGGTPAQAAMLEVLEKLDAQWENLFFGLMFATVLIAVTAAMALLAWRMRAFGARLGPVGAFREMRTPGWVVWLAIAAAMLWLCEDKWPSAALRSLSWNSAIGLFCVYCLNGFSILIYALHAMKVQAFLYYGIVLAVVLLGSQLGIHPMLGAIGLFDTWWDFRRKFDRAAAARSLGSPSDDNDK